MDMKSHAGHEGHTHGKASTDAPPHEHDHAHHHHAHGAAQEHFPAVPVDAELKDPVCGMKVTDQSLHHAEHDGRPYYFCSAKCLAKFSAEPARYLQPAPAAAPAVESPADDLHLPDAPGDPAGPSGQLPQVRHDARAG
jgi:Cu+-exporting ATPase